MFDNVVIQNTLNKISGVDEEAKNAAQMRQDMLTKPTGSMGRLEELSVQLAGIYGAPRPKINDKVIITMAGDHGVVNSGVSAYPQEVTPQMVLNMLYDGAAINVLSRHVGARVVVVDMGVAFDFEPHPALIDKKIAHGTQNMVEGPAMTAEQAQAAIAAWHRSCQC